MIIKIFFEDKPVYLSDEITDDISRLTHQPDTIFVEETSPKAVKSLLHEIARPEFRCGILLNADFGRLKKAFFKHFTVVAAAGGVVKNEKNEILFIYRRGKWDLPKGKNDGDESAKQCALREVMEETGLQQVKAGEKIITTYHTYNEFGKHIIKETEWYLMTASVEQVLIPQSEEGIEKILWVNEGDISTKLQNSFPLIADVLKGAGIFSEA